MSGRLRVVSAGEGWRVEFPEFGFAPPSVVQFATHAEALAYAVAEADRRRKPVSVYASVAGESWAPWTLRRARR